MMDSVNWIIRTSVDDAKSSINTVNNVELLQKCLDAEYDGRNRVSMIKNLKARITKIEKQRGLYE